MATRAAPRVLVVEDNHLAAEDICDLVRDHGFEVAATVGTVEKALAAARREAMDGAVLDINLHGVASFPVCSILQERGIPFLFVTGYPETVVPSELHASDLLAKPLEPSLFRSALDTMLAGTSVARTGNVLLDGLPRADRAEIWDLLKPITLAAGRLLETRGKRGDGVIFPIDGLITLNGAASDRIVEVGLIGFEGATGLASVFGTAPAFDARVQIAGNGYRMDARHVARRLAANDALGRRLLAYSQALLGQVGETAIALSHNTVVERVARRLLMTQDRLRSPRLALSHHQLAEALGVRRASVTVALQVLEGDGLIRAARKSIQIQDRQGLRRLTPGVYSPLSADFSATPRRPVN